MRRRCVVRAVWCPQLLLPRLSPASVPVVFSRNVTHTLTLSLERQDNYLHAMAKRVMVSACAR